MCFRTVSLGKLNWFISRNTSFSYVIMPTYLYPYVRRNQWFTLNGGEVPSEPPRNPIGDVLLYTVVTTGNNSNTDLYLRPYRSGRDYCSDFNIIVPRLW